MRLDATAVSILHAIFAMGLLSFLMAAWMSVARDIAMRKAGLNLEAFAHTRDVAGRMPSWARRASDNYNHLFEAPTVFYAVALAIVVGGIADPLYAGCAWTFLGLRAVHSLVQATVNRVASRAAAYALSWIPLTVMIVRPLLTIQ